MYPIGIADTKPGNFPRTFPCCAAALLLGIATVAGCSGGFRQHAAVEQYPPAQPAATPTIATTAAQNGAVIVTLGDATSGATIYYTIDGTTPTTSSPQYLAPFLVASNLTLNAIATASGYTSSAVATQTFSANIASGTLVWSDEFTNTGTGSANAQPNPTTWTYDTGTDCCGNNELETYCAWGSTTSPCNPTSPNAYVGATDGYLHIVAENPSGTVYTSARLKSEGLFSFQYGRIEARMMLPEVPGHVARLLAAGQQHHHQSMAGLRRIRHHGAHRRQQSADQRHGAPVTTGCSPRCTAPTSTAASPYTATGFSAAAWHTYGMIWSKGQIQFYVDSPTNIYETFTPTDISRHLALRSGTACSSS